MRTPHEIATQIASTMTPHGLGDTTSPLTNYERALVAAIEADRAQREPLGVGQVRLAVQLDTTLWRTLPRGSRLAWVDLLRSALNDYGTVISEEVGP